MPIFAWDERFELVMIWVGGRQKDGIDWAFTLRGVEDRNSDFDLKYNTFRKNNLTFDMSDVTVTFT